MQCIFQLLECVHYIHGLKPPIIHRDLKPENILINENPLDGRYLKLCDFGLAEELDANTVYLNRAGTRDYMAIEIRNTSGEKAKFSYYSDIYSLSVIAWDLFDFDINE